MKFRGYFILGKKKREVRTEVSNKEKNKILEDTSVSKIKLFTRSKQLKVCDTSVLLEIKVFT
jgi:hypothetical protein